MSADQRICLIDGKDLAFQIPHLVLHDFFSLSVFAAITALTVYFLAPKIFQIFYHFLGFPFPRF